MSLFNFCSCGSEKMDSLVFPFDLAESEAETATGAEVVITDASLQYTTIHKFRLQLDYYDLCQYQSQTVHTERSNIR